MKKDYFWSNHSSKLMREIFYEKLVENEPSIILEFMYKLFLNINSIECFDRECYENNAHRNKFLIYLEKLLKKGELEMMLNFDYEPRESEYNK